LPLPVSAAGNGITTGDIALVATFECIGVSVNIANDDNTNSSALLEYKATASGTWLSAYTMYFDNQSAQHQYRGSIFWLQENTSYDVRVTFSDADGVTGTNPVIASVTTRNSAPTSSGAVYYVAKTGDDGNAGSEVAPWLTIDKAASTLTSGQVCYVKAGTYTEDITFDNSGISTNWIYFRNFGTDVVTLNGGLVIDGKSYLRLSGFVINDTSTGIYVHNAAHDVIIENSTITIGGSNDDSCIFIRGEPDSSSYPYNITVQDNTLQVQTTVPYDDNEHADKDAVYWFYMMGGLVVRNNVVRWSGVANTYGPYDAFGGGPEDNPIYLKDCDFYDNVVSDCHDDGLQPDGGNVNVRVWGNTVSNSFSGISACPVDLGPLYIFRNVFYDLHYRSESGDNEGFKIGDGTTGRTYMFHNTTYVTNADTVGIMVTNAGWSNVVSRNNVLIASWYIIEAGHTGDIGPPLHDFDYDYLDTSDAERGIKWGDSTYTKTQVRDGTWTSNTVNEVHGILSGVDPRFVSTGEGNFSTLSDSPLKDTGVSLVQFNDASSPWPYIGSAPDIGAIENGLASAPVVSTTSPATAITYQSATWESDQSGFRHDC
jgi:hypothetical protein